MKKVISIYSNDWVNMFQQLSNYLKDRIKSYIRIEHVGSTSIPGMDAKPVIDMVIEISENDFKNIKVELENIGYIHCGDQGIEGREVFKELTRISRF